MSDLDHLCLGLFSVITRAELLTSLYENARFSRFTG